MLKKIPLLLLCCVAWGVYAQETVTVTPSLQNSKIKEYGGFLLDMGLLNVAPVNIYEPKVNVYKKTVDYNKLFSLDKGTVYGKSAVNTNLWGTMSGGYMNMASRNLSNGMRLNTYGMYNSQGYKTVTGGVLPWERARFNGGFELKSNNGKFGIRIDIQH